VKTRLRFFIASVLLLGAFSLVLFNSCKNKCGSTTCQNGGTCSSNVCICPTGYSGNACQIGWSDPVIGTYVCKREDCHPAVSGVNSWQSAVTKDATDGGFTVDISDFDNSNITVVATVDSAINGVSKVKVTAATGSGISASGTYANGVMNLTFTTAVGGVGSYTCDMVLTKQ